MITNTVQALQSRILSPSEIVDYASIVQEAYPNPDTYRESFYSLKIQIHDNNMNPNNAAARDSLPFSAEKDASYEKVMLLEAMLHFYG